LPSNCLEFLDDAVRNVGGVGGQPRVDHILLDALAGRAIPPHVTCRLKLRLESEKGASNVLDHHTLGGAILSLDAEQEASNDRKNPLKRRMVGFRIERLQIHRP